MKYSIVTICKNAASQVERTIRSVSTQYFKDFEYIVIDGNSEDKTKDILKEYARYIDICVSEPDNGISDAFNKGIRMARGEYLLFLNAGDMFLGSEALAKADKCIGTGEGDLYSFQIMTIMGHKNPPSMEVGRNNWCQARIPHQSTFIKRSVFERIGLFNESYKVRMDYDFFYRCLLNGMDCTIVPVPIVFFESNGISSKNKYLHGREGLAIRLLYGQKIEESDKEMMNYIKNVDEGVGMIDETEQVRRKDRMIIVALYYYLQLRNKGISLGTVLAKQGYHKVAIYGYGFIGKALYEDLCDCGLEVLYVVDKNEFDDDLVRSFADEWNPVDCMIVTPFYDFDAIKRDIDKKGNYNPISFEEILASSGIEEIRL